MNEQNFDKTLKQKMAEERDFPFSEDKWDKMERKLDDFHAQKRYERLVWASALSFVGLLGVLLFVVSQLRDTKSTLSDLTQKVQKLHDAQPPVFTDSVRKDTPIQRDTVYHHVIVRRYDTIFQTVVQRGLSETGFKNMDIDKAITHSKTHASVIDLPLSSSEKTDLGIQNSNNNDKTTKPVNDSPSNEIVNINPEVGKQPTDKQAPKSEIGILKLKIDTLSADKQALKSEIGIPKSESDTLSADKPAPKSEISIPKSEIDTLSADKPAPKSEIDIPKPEIVPPGSIVEEKASNQRKPILKPLNLNGYEIGLSSGSAFIGDKDIKHQMGYSVGLRGGVGLGQRFKVVGEAQFIGSHYKLNNFSTRKDIPTVNPPTVNDELSSIQVQQSGGRVFLGVQYDVTRSRLRPYVGVGAVGAFDIEEKYRFKFINRLTNEGTVMAAKNRSQDFDDVYWRVSAGVSYPIFKKLKVQLEGSFDAPFDHKRYNKPLLQLKGAVLYRF